MNKKKLITSLLVVCLVVVIIIVIVKVTNKPEEETSTTGITEEVVESEYTTQEWKDNAKNTFEAATGKTATDIKLYSDNKDIMIIEIYTDGNTTDYTERYNLNYRTGTGTDLSGNTVDLNMEK